MTIRWVTYQLDSMYQVLGTGYNEPEDAKGRGDGVHAYVRTCPSADPCRS